MQKIHAASRSYIEKMLLMLIRVDASQKTLKEKKVTGSTAATPRSRAVSNFCCISLRPSIAFRCCRVYKHPGLLFHAPQESIGGARLPLPGLEPIGGEPLMSVICGQCDVRPTVTFPAAMHNCPLAGTKLYCLVTEAHVC